MALCKSGIINFERMCTFSPEKILKTFRSQWSEWLEQTEPIQLSMARKSLVNCRMAPFSVDF